MFYNSNNKKINLFKVNKFLIILATKNSIDNLNK